MGSFLMSIYYSTSQQVTVMPYEALYNSEKQGAGPIKNFHLEVESVRFQQVFAVPECCLVVFKVKLCIPE
jgi:hypothetical protein